MFTTTSIVVWLKMIEKIVMQIMFALLGNILTAECGSAYSRNIYRKIENDLCCLINNEWRGK